MKSHKKAAITLAAIIVSLSQSAYAGRPLLVDDANLNDVGAGHVEAWYARLPHSVNTWNIAPAYSPIIDIEFAALMSRDSSNQLTTSAIQGKWRITPSNPEGCNLAMAVGISHLSNGGGNTPFLNGIGTCNHKGGAFSLNLGVSHPTGGKNQMNGGVAYERELGSVTGHVEYYWQEGGKPVVQVGLRHDIVPKLQLDGTVGRSDGDVVFSLGLKKSF
jgi:hypothetical protein